MKITLLRSAAIVLPLVMASGAIGQTMAPATASGAKTLSKADTEFVAKAAEGGMAEVQMAQLAQQKSQNAGVKDFAQHMIDDHTPNNQKLMTIASSKGVTAPSEPSAAQKEMMTKLQGMEGAKFDHAYLTGQVKAHQTMLKLFEREATNGSDTDLKSFAETTVPTIQQHITMAQSTK